jgi:hypothetical protein
LSERVPMDVTVGWGNAPMARLMRAVVRHKCAITDSMMLIGCDAARPTDSVFLRVQVPGDSLDAFRDEVKPQDMRIPPQVGVLSMDQPLPPPRCTDCGKPQHAHPYRHPFKPDRTTP